MTTTTTTLDTELSAVNSILGSIGQSPISQLDFTNPEVSFVYNLLKESNQDVQAEGWTFNLEYHIKNSSKTSDNMLRRLGSNSGPRYPLPSSPSGFGGL